MVKTYTDDKEFIENPWYNIRPDRMHNVFKMHIQNAV